jgi:hypothetical protein
MKIHSDLVKITVQNQTRVGIHKANFADFILDFRYVFILDLAVNVIVM